MPKPREIEDILKSKFHFVPAKAHSKDHRYYQFNLDGLPPIITKVSHNKKEIGKNLLSKIARQLRVKGPFFYEMFSCTKSNAEYVNQVRTEPYPPFDLNV